MSAVYIMANLKRKRDLMGCGVDNSGSGSGSGSGSNCCSNIKSKHPRLLMGGKRRVADVGSTSKHLVIEYSMDSQRSQSATNDSSVNLLSLQEGHGNAELCSKACPTQHNTLAEVPWPGPALHSNGDVPGDPSKRKGLLEQKNSLTRTSSFDLYQQLAPYAKGGLDTERLPTSTADNYTAQRLCSLRLNHLTELMQQGTDVGTEQIIKNLQYAKEVLETLPALEKTRRNSEHLHIAHTVRRFLDEEDEWKEVGPDSVPPEVKDWLAQTFTKTAAPAANPSGAKLRLKSVVNVVRAGLLVDRIYRHTTYLSPDHHKAPPDQVSAILKHVEKWEFDIWELNKISENRAMRYIGYELINRERLLFKLKINPACLDNFLSALEVGYSKFNNPYHNLIHGADVTQTTYYLLHQSKLMNWLTDIELLAILVAALIHDYEHTGTTNSYHIMSGSRLARMYNDRSVLENHHISAAFELLRSEERNILSNLNKEQFYEFRSLVVDMVLATDMTNHFTQIKDMKALLTCPKNIEKSKVLSLLLHAADISHPAKPWSVHKPWTDRLIEEFFKQGDMENEQGLTCSPLCDRNTTMVEESQIVFLNVIVQPTMNILGDVLDRVVDVFSSSPHSKKESYKMDRPWEKNMETNRKNWVKLSEAPDVNENVKESNKNVTTKKETSEIPTESGDTTADHLTTQQVVLE